MQIVNHLKLIPFVTNGTKYWLIHTIRKQFYSISNTEEKFQFAYIDEDNGGVSFVTFEEATGYTKSKEKRFLKKIAKYKVINEAITVQKILTKFSISDKITSMSYIAGSIFVLDMWDILTSIHTKKDSITEVNTNNEIYRILEEIK